MALTVFVAGVGVICVGRSLFLIPAIWLFSFLTVEQTALCMAHGGATWQNGGDHPLFGVTAVRLYQTLNPGLSWGVVVLAAAILMVALTRAHKRVRSSPMC